MIRRDIENKIIDSLKLKEITVVTGARQVGKTTVLKEVISWLEKKGRKVIYLNLDIEDDNRFLSSQQELLSKIELEAGGLPAYVFIDEIQQKKDAERFLKGIFDMGLPHKFIVTGSGSLELKEKISEALTGRKYMIEMSPVSFREFVNYKTGYKYTGRLGLFFRAEKEKTALLLNEYLAFGGYPAVITADSISRKREIMNEVFSSYITKDVSYLLGVRAQDKFVKLIRLLSAYAGSLVNYSQLAMETGLRSETLKNYLWYAEQTFIIKTVKPFYTNIKKEITKSPVIYFNDTGMLNFSKGVFGLPVVGTEGMLFQNFVYNLLKRSGEEGLSKVNFWRSKDKAEVDFILHENGKPVPVEVKFSDLKKPVITRSFRSFLKKYNPEKGMLVNLSYEDELKVENTPVEFVPFWNLV